jgi:hypothetical protein
VGKTFHESGRAKGNVVEDAVEEDTLVAVEEDTLVAVEEDTLVAVEVETVVEAALDETMEAGSRGGRISNRFKWPDR